MPEDFPEGQYRRKDWRRGWVLLFVGALVLVAGLVGDARRRRVVTPR